MMHRPHGIAAQILSISSTRMRYRLRRPTSMLIGPEGLIPQSDLRGPAITDALAEALGAKWGRRAAEVWRR